MNTIYTYLSGAKNKQSLFFILLLLSYSSYAQVDWIKYTTESTTFGSAQPNDMAISQTGDIFVVGNYNGDPAFDDTTILGLRDPIFLAKYQADGSVTWVQQIGGNSNNDGNTVATNDLGHVYISGVYQHSNSNTILDFGNLTLAGDIEENLFLAKADASGTFLWAVGIIVDDLLGPDQNITPRDMIVDGNGDVYITGEMIGSVNIEGVKYNTNPLDIDKKVLFIAKFKPDGSLDWFRQTNNNISTGFAIGQRLALASNGDIFLSGEYEDISYDGDSLPNISDESNEKFVARIDPSGDMIWIHPMASRLADQESFHIGVDQNDHVYTLLNRSSNIYFQDTTVLFPYDFKSPHLIIKLDENGNRLFFKDTGYPSVLGSHNITEPNLTTGEDGTTFFTGNAFAFADFMIFGNDSLYLDSVPNSSFIPTPFIAAFDANGNALGVENYIDEHLNNLFDYEVETASMGVKDGKVLMTGFLKGDFRFGNDTIMTGNFDQLFLTQVDPEFLKTSTGIEQMSERLAFQIYPNPAQDRVVLELNEWRQSKEVTQVELFDLSGKLLQKNHFSAPSLQLNISELASGYYVVILRNKQGSYAKKLQVW